MAIIKTVGFREFVREFELFGRQKNFTHSGMRALFDYFEECSVDAGAGYELDVIQLCCEYSEHTWQEIAADYSVDIDDELSTYDKISAVRDYLDNETTIIGENDGVFVYATF